MRYPDPSLSIRVATRARRAEEALAREGEHAVLTLAALSDAVVTTNLVGSITFMNPAAERLSGWNASDALGRPVETVLPLAGEAAGEMPDSLPAMCLREGRTIERADDVVVQRRDGTEPAVTESAAPLFNADGHAIGVALVLRDVSASRLEARRLLHDATHDSLTGLISRREFEGRLTRLLAQPSGTDPHSVLCYLDLDRFKRVNDTSGHEAGDSVLGVVGTMLQRRLRARDTIGRLGGDEFGILLEHCTVSKASEIAAGIVRAIEETPFEWGDETFSLGASIGVVPIALTPGGASGLLRAADRACYAAKNAGGGRFRLAPDDATPEQSPSLNGAGAPLAAARP